MRATSKHIKNEVSGPGVTLHIVEYDADDLDGEWRAEHEIGWFSYDAAGRIRETLQQTLADYSQPLKPRDVERLRDFIRQVKDKHAHISQLKLGE